MAKTTPYGYCKEYFDLIYPHDFTSTGKRIIRLPSNDAISEFISSFKDLSYLDIKDYSLSTLGIAISEEEFNFILSDGHYKNSDYVLAILDYLGYSPTNLGSTSDENKQSQVDDVNAKFRSWTLRELREFQDYHEE